MTVQKILFSVGTLEAGGLERFVTRVAVEGKKTGALEPEVLCLSKKTGRFLEDLETLGVPVSEAPSGWERRPAALRRLRSLVQSIEPDLVHSQVNFAMVQQLLAYRGPEGRAVCITERNCYPLSGFSRLKRQIQFKLLRAAGAAYSANSAAVARHLSRMVGVPGESIPVLPNGIPKVQPDPEVRARLRSELGVREDSVVLGYVGRMAPHKGQDRFLRVLSVLKRDGMCPFACLVGDGPRRSALEELASSAALANDLVFTGTVTNVKEYMQAFDALVLLSAHEGMPNVILEGMAAGLPILASGAGSIPELLDDGDAGVLIRRDDLEEIATKLAELCRDASLRTTLGLRARERCEAAYGFDTAFSRLLGHYRAVTAKRCPPR